MRIRGVRTAHSLASRARAVTVVALVLVVSSGTGGRARADGSPAFVAVSVATTGRTTLAVPVPTGTAPGDVMVAAVAEHEVGTVTPPDGWVLVRQDLVPGDVWQWAWYHVATAADPPTYTWVVGDRDANGAIVTYRGIDVTNPLVAHTGEARAQGASIRCPSVDVPVGGATLVMFAMIEGPSPNPVSPPSGFTERAEWPVHPTLEVSDSLLARAGPSGDQVAQAQADGGHVGTLVALRPASQASEPGG